MKKLLFILFILTGFTFGQSLPWQRIIKFYQHNGHTNSTIQAPTNIIATPGTQQIAVAWNGISGATFNLYYSTSTFTDYTTVDSVVGVTSPYDLTSLSDNTEYFVGLIAIKDGKRSVLSNVVSAYTLLPAPANPVATAGTEQNTISWDAEAGATSYNIYWAESSPITKSSNKITGATSPYVHSSLTGGTTYYYAVTAVNANGESELSSEVNGMPTIAQFTLTPSITHGTITPATAQTIDRGSNQRFTWIADAGYKFGYYDVGGSNLTDSTSAYTFKNVQADGEINVTCVSNDTIPNAFSFTDVTNADLNSYHTGNVTVSGFDSAWAYCAGDSFKVNSGSLRTSAIKVYNGDVIYLPIVASGSYSTAVNHTLTVGGVSDTYTVTTKANTTYTLYYVDKNATGTGDGSSWTNALPSLAALQGTNIGDTEHDTAYVAGGTYDKDSLINFTPTNRIVITRAYQTGYNTLPIFAATTVPDSTVTTANLMYNVTLKMYNANNININGLKFTKNLPDTIYSQNIVIMYSCANDSLTNSIFENDGTGKVISIYLSHDIVYKDNSILQDSNSVYWTALSTTNADNIGIVGGNYNITFDHNFFKNNSMVGDGSTDFVQTPNMTGSDGYGQITFKNNFFYANVEGSSAVNHGIYVNQSSNNHVLIYNNIFDIRANSAFESMICHPTTESDKLSLKIFNNTIIQSGHFIPIYIGAWCDSVWVVNNLVKNIGSGDYALGFTEAKHTHIDYLDVHNNKYYASGGSPLIYDSAAGNDIDWTTWQSDGYDNNSISGAIYLLNEGDTTFGAYKLTSEDDAVGAGYDLSSYFTRDAQGTTITSWNMGAITGDTTIIHIVEQPDFSSGTSGYSFNGATGAGGISAWGKDSCIGMVATGTSAKIYKTGANMTDGVGLQVDSTYRFEFDYYYKSSSMTKLSIYDDPLTTKQDEVNPVTLNAWTHVDKNIIWLPGSNPGVYFYGVTVTVGDSLYYHDIKITKP